MPLILENHEQYFFRSKPAKGFFLSSMPYIYQGKCIVSRKYRDAVISSPQFCEALQLGKAEIIEDTDRAPTVKETLSAFLQIDETAIKDSDNIFKLASLESKRQGACWDFERAVESAFGIEMTAQRCANFGRIQHMTVAEAIMAIPEILKDMEGE